MNHKELAWLAVPAQIVIAETPVGISLASVSVFYSENKPGEKRE